MLPSGPNRSDMLPASIPGAETLGMVSAAEPLGDPSLRTGTSIISVSEEAPSSMPDVSAILNALRRRWFPALLLGLIMATAGGVGTRLLLPVKFTARARFHIASKAPSIIFQSDSGADLGNYQRTQVEMIKSQLVLDPVLKRPEVALLPCIQEQPDPMHWIEDQLICEFPAPEILRLSLTGRDPGQIETLLGAISEAYLREVGNKELFQREGHLEQLNKVRDKRDAELEKLRKLYQQHALDTGATDPKVLANAQVLVEEELHEVRMQLIQVQNYLRAAKVDKELSEEKGDKNGPSQQVKEADIEEQMRKDGQLSEFLTRRRGVLSQQRILRESKVVGEGHPSYKRLTNDLKDIDDAVRARREELRPGIIKLLMSGGVPGTASNPSHSIAYYERLEKQLLDDIDRLNKQTKSINRNSLDLDRLRDDIERSKRTAELVGNQAESLKVELDAPKRVEFLEKPTVEQTVNSKKQIMATAGAAIGGLALAFVAVIGWELRARRVLDPNQLSNSMRIRILGTLPVLAASRTGRAHMLENRSTEKYPSDLLTESVDRARLKLLNAGREQTVKVILITSATSGEGKTSLASHLAVSLARAGRRTLLIDADLRRPSLHKLFDVLPEPGLAAVLREEMTVADVIRPTVIRGLEMIPAGRGDLDALQALNQDRVRVMFEQLKQNYDFVLVDSAPVLPVIDASIIAQYVDGVLFSVMCGVSHLPSLHQSSQELAQLGVRILGAVVSGARLPTGTYGYPPLDLKDEE